MEKESTVEKTRNFIGFPQPCQTDSVSAAHVGHVESSNGSPVPVPQIDLIPGLMGLKQTYMIKSASTSLRQKLPTLKFSSSGPLGGTQILARGLISQFTSLSLHYKYLTSCLKMNPLRPNKDESILKDFRRTFSLFWSLQTLLKALLRPSKQIFQTVYRQATAQLNSPAVGVVVGTVPAVSRSTSSQSQCQSWPHPAEHIPDSPGTELSTVGQTGNPHYFYGFYTEKFHPLGASTSLPCIPWTNSGQPETETKN